MVLRFNEHMLVDRVVNLSSYSLNARFTGAAPPAPRFAQADYDDEFHQVRLFFQTPLPLHNLRTLQLRVRSGAAGLVAFDGTPLDGDNNHRAGGDALIRYTAVRGQSVKWSELDGDQLTLELRGGGSLTLLRRERADEDQVWLLDAVPGVSRLAAALRPGRRTNGIGRIQELVGLEGVDSSAVTENDLFRVLQSTLGPDADPIQCGCRP